MDKQKDIKLAMTYQFIQVPPGGSSIRRDEEGRLEVPDCPIIPFIEGDGVGQEIMPIMRAAVDTAVTGAYGGKRRIHWMEVFNGEKAAGLYDGDWFPQETISAIREHKVVIKGPLTTPVGGGFRSLNVALRQEMDLFVNMRPVRWLDGMPSPLKQPENTDMVIFRENSEDVYAGIEFKAGSQDAERLMEVLQHDFAVNRVRFPERCGIGIKPISQQGTERLVRQAIHYALREGRDSVTLVHKGNILKFTEGAFKHWGYELAINDFGAVPADNGRDLLIERQHSAPLVIKDVIADHMFQQLLLFPQDYDVLATTCQNGDYLADALAAQVGGVSLVPAANMSDEVAIFEPTHGTAHHLVGQDKMNPTSLLLAAELLLNHLGWVEAAEKLLKGISEVLSGKLVTFDLAAQRKGATEASCSQFGDLVVQAVAQE